MHFITYTLRRTYGLKDPTLNKTELTAPKELLQRLLASPEQVKRKKTFETGG